MMCINIHHVKKLNYLGGPSLASQTPYFSEEREKGSGNTAYNEFYLAKECGATNEIASLLISIRH